MKAPVKHSGLLKHSGAVLNELNLVFSCVYFVNMLLHALNNTTT